MALEVYNTLTGKKEPFVPLAPPEVGMYVCGLTVYDLAHIGHARTYVAFDVIRRFLEWSGYRVKHIQNITDVDDKIINRAKETGENPIALAARMTAEADKDLDALGITRALAYPKVSENIEGIIEMTQELIKRGHAYVGSDGVYFDVATDPDYGKLSHINLDQMLDEARKESAEGKRNAVDFALWKAAKPGEISWPSPWGPGRPGWHIECSVMATKHLGPRFDIHGGGRDLTFPHHENEIAQTESATGLEPAVKYWLHTGFLTVEGEKMSKSLGNFITIRTALSSWAPEVLRLWLVGTHYRSPIDYSEAGLAQAKANVERIGNMLDNVAAALKGARSGPAASQDVAFAEQVAARRAAWVAAMENDLNTPIALAALFELVGDLNKYAAADPHGPTLEAAQGTFKELAGVFGLATEKQEAGVGALAEDLLTLLLDVRQTARATKNWAMSDKIRDGLLKLGIVIEDTEKGPRWKRKA